ncbi:hypothetical protein D3C81_1896360 [compost metagenome]
MALLVVSFLLPLSSVLLPFSSLLRSSFVLPLVSSLQPVLQISPWLRKRPQRADRVLQWSSRRTSRPLRFPTIFFPTLRRHTLLPSQIPSYHLRPVLPWHPHPFPARE